MAKDRTEAQMHAEWQAQDDARSVADAAAVQADPKRLAAARLAAKKMVVEEKKRAADMVLRSNAMSSLARTPVKAKPAAAPKPKPKAKPKPKPKPKPAARKKTSKTKARR